MNSLSYVKTPECLTIAANGKLIYVQDADGKLTAQLATNDFSKASQFLLDDNLSISQLQNALKLSQHTEFVTHDGKLFFASIEGLIAINPALGGRLIELKEQGLPYHPLLKFWVKFSTSPAARLKEEYQALLFDRVGTPKCPLTWDGNLLAYFRSHHGSLPHSTPQEDRPIDLLSFRQFNRETAFDETSEEEIGGRKFNLLKQDGSAKPLYSLSEITSLCMDLGGIYEVEVEPQNLVDLSRHPSNLNLYSSTAYGIRSLGLASSEQNQGFIEMPVSECTGGLSLRSPNSLGASAAYLTELVGASAQSRTQIAEARSSYDRVAVTGC